MIYEIKNLWNDNVLFSTEVDPHLFSTEQARLAVEAAIKSGADLRGADLRDANLIGADLSDAYLRDANLRDADLSYANLIGANLSDAYLRGADLRGADLSDAYLRGANLRGADLRGANLRDANLIGADLSDAYLRGADLRGANLRDANLRDADLSYARLWSTIGNKEQLHSMQIEKYDVCFGLGIMQIGCERRSISEWKAFDDCTIEKMDDGALDWWRKWKDFIFTAIKLVEDKE